MLNVKSLLSSYHEYYKGSEYSFALIRQPGNKYHPDQVSIVLEGVNSKNELVIKRYDYAGSPTDFRIDRQEEIIDTKNPKSTILKWLSGGYIIGGCTSQLSRSEAEKFQKNIASSGFYIGLFNYIYEDENHHCCPSIVQKLGHLKTNDSYCWARDLLFSITNQTWDSIQPILNSLNYEEPLNCSENIPEKNITVNEINNQLNDFNNAIGVFKENGGSEDIIKELEQLYKQLLKEPHTPLPSPANDMHSFVITSFTEFTKMLNGLDHKFLLFRTQLLADRLEKQLAEKYTNTVMSPTLNSALCGVIGAVVGFATGATIGAAVTSWSGGLGALPGAILGAVKGFTVGTALGLGMGGISGALTSSIGFFYAKDKQNLHAAEIQPLELAQNTIKRMEPIMHRLDFLRREKDPKIVQDNDVTYVPFIPSNWNFYKK